MCSLDKRYGNDPTEDQADEDPDELEYECSNCGHEYVGTLSDDCPECGHDRCRYAGPLPGDDSESTDDTNRVTT